MLRQIATTKCAIAVFALLIGGGQRLCAQGISGDWQGSLPGLRIVVHIAPADNGTWKATLYSMAVTDALKLEKPVLAGHSLAGEELSSIANRHPDKTAGVICHDAGFPYALYDPARGDLQLDALDTQQKLLRLTRGEYSNDQEQLIESLLSNLPQLEKDLQEQWGNLRTMPSFSRGFPQSSDPIVAAIHAGEHKYTKIQIPCFAIFAVPPNLGSLPISGPERMAAEARFLQSSAQAKAFETKVPSCRVVRISNAEHLVFKSNEADVLREINAFIGALP